MTLTEFEESVKKLAADHVVIKRDNHLKRWDVFWRDPLGEQVFGSSDSLVEAFSHASKVIENEGPQA